MTTLTKEQINKKIGLFEGGELVKGAFTFYGEFVSGPYEYIKRDDKYIPVKDLAYTSSLDALVPVWEKLDAVLIPLCVNFKECEIVLKEYHQYYFKSDGETIQHAAALTTYKAIIELENNNESNS